MLVTNIFRTFVIVIKTVVFIRRLLKLKIMTNIEKLEGLGILGEVRQRKGGNDEHDKRFDEEINKMSNNMLIGSYAGYVLGSGTWWFDLKQKFDELEELDQEFSQNN